MRVSTQQLTILVTVSALILLTIVGGWYAFTKIRSIGTPQQASIQQRPSSVQREPMTQRPPTDVTPTAVVVYTDSGYAPDPMIVKTGTTVIFENKSTKKMWTASDQHPSHRLYPTQGGCIGSSFDACQGVAPEGSWGFAFDRVGSWNYHNHLYATDGGTIVVQE